jgi:hypothetical protein
VQPVSAMADKWETLVGGEGTGVGATVDLVVTGTIRSFLVSAGPLDQESGRRVPRVLPLSMLSAVISVLWPSHGCLQLALVCVLLTRPPCV